ncbi:MAG TPA: SLOG family protein [Chloroflexia bacterium]|nr:SLOG family protein [Chloroflexia bacterium]
MKTIIAGSRTLHGVELVEEAVRRSGFTVGTVISGTASGIDRAGEAWAEQHNIPVVRRPANWDRFGKSAGYRRNEQMAQIADAAIVITMGDAAASPGAHHMIDIARKRGLKLFVYRPANPPALTAADQDHIQLEVDRARQAGARYNELHTVYWHAVEAAKAAGRDPQQDEAVQAAHQKLVHAQPLLKQIRAGAQAAALAAGWNWPDQPNAPWAAPTPPAAATTPAAAPAMAPAAAKTSRRTPLPAPVAIGKDDPPAVQQAKARLNAQIAAAGQLGKSGAWAPLKNALSALERLLNLQPRQILAH